MVFHVFGEGKREVEFWNNLFEIIPKLWEIFGADIYYKTYCDPNDVTPIYYSNISQEQLEKIHECLRDVKLFDDKEINNFIKSCNEIATDDYVFLADYDDCTSDSECIENVKRRFSNLQEEKIVIVKKEIESWLIAGLPEEDCKKINHRICKNCVDGKVQPNCTENIPKGCFYKLRPAGVDEDLYFKRKLKDFNLNRVGNKNSSLSIFVDKYLKE